jgi:hypothetical protein
LCISEYTLVSKILQSFKHQPTKRKRGEEDEPQVSLLDYGVMVWSEIFLIVMNNDNVEGKKKSG